MEAHETYVEVISPGTPREETESDLRRQERLRILLVDDEPDILELLAAMLRRRGWEVVCAASASEALSALAADSFNLVLMDIQMPELSGVEAAQVIRSRERKQQDGYPSYTPIVALTAWARSEFRQACREAGMDDFLAKPIGMVNLWAAVERNARPASSH